MKISIGSRYLNQPYGGGNEFIKNLTERLIREGNIVVNNLKDNDIDIVLLTNPLKKTNLSTFNNYDIDYYITFINKNAITLQRINECDERKNTNYVNNSIIKFNKNIDSNIFVSDWISNLFIKQGINSKYSKVIKGGPSSEIFNLKNKKPWNKSEKLKIVTHHWSDNPMKGIDLYLKLDSLCSDEKLGNKIEFTYIGNIKNKNKFKNTKFISPLNGNELSDEIKKHHVYITGSQNEPSGNHHMEGAMCGLPIIFIASGALPEYCSEYGILTEVDNLQINIYKIMENYDVLFKKLQSYSFTFESAYREYLEHLEFLLLRKNEIVYNRKKLSKFKVIFNYLFNKLNMNLLNAYHNTRVKFGKLKRLYIVK